MSGKKKKIIKLNDSEYIASLRAKDEESARDKNK